MKRHAVVIGINEWRDKRIQNLKCAERDAREVAGLLHRLQFSGVELLQGKEADAHKIYSCLEALGKRLSPGDFLLFYFAGHGITNSGRHYLLCWDARRETVGQEDRVGLIGVHTVTEMIRPFHRLLITDACRSGFDAGRAGGAPGFAGGVCCRNLGRAHAEETAAHVHLNSCEDNKLAAELENHGLFTQAFLDLCHSKLATRQPLSVGAAFRDELGHHMQGLAEANGFPSEEQWPLLVEGRPLPLALDGTPTESLSSPLAGPAQMVAARPLSSTAEHREKSADGPAIARQTAVDEACAVCGKRFVTGLDRVGTCQYSGCARSICNWCWTAQSKRFCREHLSAG